MAAPKTRLTGGNPQMVVRCTDYPACKWIGMLKDVPAVKCPRCGRPLTIDPVPPASSVSASK